MSLLRASKLVMNPSIAKVAVGMSSRALAATGLPSSLPRASDVAVARSGLESKQPLRICARPLAIAGEPVEAEPLAYEAKASTPSAHEPIRSWRTKTAEISLWQCTKRIWKEVADVFRLAGEAADVLIVTVVLRTTNDMAAWTGAVAEERQELTKQMIDFGNDVVQRIKKTSEKAWCDFIDPASGYPFLQEPSQSYLVETSPVFGQLGVRVEDVGCCKVVRHPRFGTRAFLGSLWTTAAAEDVRSTLDAVSELLFAQKAITA